MPWAPKTYMFIEVFMGYIYNLVFQVAFRSNPLFLSMGFLEVFSMGFSSHILCLPLQEVGWTFVGLLHFSVRLHRTCSIGEYRPRLGHCRIKAEVFKLIYGFLDFFLKENPKEIPRVVATQIFFMFIPNPWGNDPV